MAGTMVASFALPGVSFLSGPGALPGFLMAGSQFSMTALNTASFNWMTTGNFEPNWTAAGLSAIPGLINGFAGGIDAVRHGGDFFSGKGYKLSYEFKGNASDFSGKQESVSVKSIEERVAQKGFDRSTVNEFYANSTTPKGGKLGEAVWMGRKIGTDITIYKPAFVKTELLDLVIGHEIMHAKYYMYFSGFAPLSQKWTYRDNMQFFHGHIEHNVILRWMHIEYMKNSLAGATNRNAVFIYAPSPGAPIVNPY